MEKMRYTNNPKTILLDENSAYRPIKYWVIRTLEKIPRFVEQILIWEGGKKEYGIVPYKECAKVYKRNSPPYKEGRDFEKIMGINVVFQEVTEEDYKEYKKLVAYYNNDDLSDVLHYGGC